MPHSQDVRVDVTLTNFVRNYKYEMQRFYADVVAPVKPVVSSAGRYKTLGQELLDIAVTDTGSDRGEAHSLDYAVSEGTYACLERKLKIFVSDKEIKQSPSGFDPLKQAAITVTHALKLRQEKRIVDLAEATANEVSDVTDWDDASATIVANVLAAKAGLKGLVGRDPTHFVIGDHVADEIVGQEDIVNLIQYAAAMQKPTNILKSFSADELPERMFGMQLCIANSLYNTAQPGAAISIGRVWADHAYVFFVDPGQQGATWAIQPESTKFTITKWRENDPPGWWVMGSWERDEIEVTSGSVYQIVDVT